MRIITNLRQINRNFKKPVVTIGIFDGVHLGHKKILKAVIRAARDVGGTSIVITFDPHPLNVLDMIGSPPLLVSLRHRLNLIASEGIDAACVINFSKILAGRRAIEFIENVLIKKIGVYAVIIGSDFRFGKNKEGDIKLLRSFGRRFGFLVKGVPLLKVGGAPVSSTLIRSFIMRGRLKEASRLLGRPVSILGTVVGGSKRGRILGFPTANINPHHEAIPPSGVYAVYVLVDGKRHKGVLNIGFRPTFSKRVTGCLPAGRQGSRVTGIKKEPVIELHIFDFYRGIYSKDIEVIFTRKLREEKRFSTTEELIKQIRIDERNANMVLYLEEEIIK